MIVHSLRSETATPPHIQNFFYTFVLVQYLPVVFLGSIIIIYGQFPCRFSAKNCS